MFSEKIINGYWIKVMTINTVTDLKDYLFYFKKGRKYNIWKQFNPSDPASLGKSSLAI